MSKDIVLGNLYDFNKQIMKQAAPLSQQELRPIKHKLEDWFNWQLDGYAMLLCRERYDFTVFHLYEKLNKNPPAVATNELLEALNNRGEIISIEKTNDDEAWEIWLRIDEEMFVYYLFCCDDWVIQC